jgi:hypothetical protein
MFKLRLEYSLGIPSLSLRVGSALLDTDLRRQMQLQKAIYPDP